MFIWIDTKHCWSPRLARSHYCRQLTMSVCLSLSVCLSVMPLQSSNCFFFFVSWWNRAIFWPSVLHVAVFWHSTKLFSSIFDLGPLMPKIYSPKLFLHKIAYKSACMADTPQMFGPTRGFSGMADSMEPCKILWADPCCHGSEIWARRGNPVAYRLVCFLFFLVVSTSATDCWKDSSLKWPMMCRVER